MKSYKTIQVNGKQVRLHRHLMETKLKRKLDYNEVVHHKNGDKHDNRIENLEVVSRSQHMSLHPEILKKFIEKNTYNFDISTIKKMYKTMTISQISDFFKVSPMTIWKRLKDNGVKTTKIDYNDVKEIKKLLLNGMPQKEIAKKFNVSIQTISNIKTGYRYGTK